MWNVKFGFKIEMLLCALVRSEGSSYQFKHAVTKAKDGKRKGEMNGKVLRRQIRQGLWLVAYDRRRKKKSPRKPQYFQLQ